MGCIPVLAACITTLNIQFADLPTEALSYDGTPRDVSEFYNQKVPNFYIGGAYRLKNKDVIYATIDTGTHTKKIDTLGLTIAYQKKVKLDDNWTLTGSLQASYNLTKHSPCTDSYDRQYYCGNLTAWSEIKGTTHEIDPKISISLRTTW